jgi:hypothetical protein
MTIWWKPSEKMPKEWEWVTVTWHRNDGIVWCDQPIGRARYSNQYGWVPVRKHYYVSLWAENP